MPNTGFKIAKSDYNITSPDHKMIMTSKYPVLKLFDSDQGTLTKSYGESQEVVTIAHNLGYIPQVYVYGQYLNENDYPTATVVNRYKLFSWSDTPGLELWERYRYYADSTNLYIIFSTDAYVDSSIDLDYLYFIFYDPEE